MGPGRGLAPSGSLFFSLMAEYRRHAQKTIKARSATPMAMFAGLEEELYNKRKLMVEVSSVYAWYEERKE